MSDTAFRPIIETIDRAKRIVATCHVGPDGDALGAILGFTVAARNAGKEAVATFGEPFVPGEMYRYLPLDTLVAPDRLPQPPDVVVSFDAGSLDRLGSVIPYAQKATSLIVVDHHASNTGFGSINLIDPSAAASTEILYHLLGALGWTIDATVAMCLHTGLVTDTGRFQYSNATPAALRVGADLIAAGAQPEVIGRHVYEEAPYGYLLLAGRVLSRAVLEPELRLVWTHMTRADLAETGTDPSDTDPLIDTLRLARESDVACLAKEVEEGVIKVSLRSRGRVDVGAIAVELGGGGHHNAAGFTLPGTVEEVVAKVRERLPEPEGSAA